MPELKTFMSRFRTLFIVTASLILLVGFGTFFRANLLAFALSKVLNSQVVIGEIEHLDPGSVLDVRLAGLRITNDEVKVEVGSLFLLFDVGMWLRGEQFSIRNLELSDAKIHYYPDHSEKETSEVSNKLVLPLEYRLKNIEFSYQDEDQDWHARFAVCSGVQSTTADLLEVNCRGEVNGEQLELVGYHGMPDDEHHREPVNFDFSWREFSGSAEGMLDSIDDPEGVSLEVSLDSETAQPLLELLGIHEFRDGPLRARVLLEDQGEHFSFETSASIGEFDARIIGATKYLLQPDKVDATLSLSGPSLYEVGALFNEFRLRPQPFTAESEFSRDEQNITLHAFRLQIEQGVMQISGNIPDFPSVLGMHLKVGATDFKPNFIRPIADACQLPHEPVNLTAKLSIPESNRQLVSLEASAPSYDVAVSGDIDTAHDEMNLKMDIGMALKSLGQCFSIELPAEPGHASFQMNKQGNRLWLHDLAIDFLALEVNGSASMLLSAQAEFDTQLQFKFPDTQLLLQPLLPKSITLAPFPSSGSVALEGNRDQIVLKQMDFLVAGQSGKLNGVLGKPGSFDGLELQLDVSGENLRQVLVDRQANSDLPQRYTLSTEVSYEQGDWVVSNLNASISQTEVTLSGRITDDPLYVGSKLDVAATGQNIENLLGPWISHPVPNLPFSVTANVDLTRDYFRFKDVNASVGEHALTVDLVLDRPPNMTQTGGQLSFTGPSTTEIAMLLGIDHEFLDRTYQIAFTLDGSIEEVLLSNLDVRIGESDLTGRARVKDTKPVEFDIDVASQSLYLPLFDPSLASEQAVEVETEKEASVYPDFDFPLDWMEDYSGQLKYRVDKMWARPNYVTAITADIKLQDRELGVNEFSWHGEHSSGNLMLAAKAVEEKLQLALTAQSTRLPLIWLLAGEALPSKDTNFQATLSGEGTDVASLAGSLNGQILFKGGAGSIAGNALDRLFGDFFSDLSKRITAKDENRSTEIACTAGAIYIDNGVSYLNPGLVARAKQFDVYAGGTLDLKSERPDMFFMTKARTGIGFSPLKILAPRLKVGGTMAAPKYSVDTTKSALSAGAAFFTGGMSVLAAGMWDRMSAGSDPCGVLYHQALSMPQYSGLAPK